MNGGPGTLAAHPRTGTRAAPEARPTAHVVLVVLPASMLAASVVTPALVTAVVPLRLFVVVALVVTIFAMDVLARGPGPATSRSLVLATAVAGALAVTWLWGGLSDDPDIVLNAQRCLVVLPLGLLAGAAVFRNRHSARYLEVVVVWGLLSSVAGVVEMLLARSLVGRTDVLLSLSRDGHVRALVASEHPLVLGAVLASLVPLVRTTRLRCPTLAAAVLVAGVASTGSRAPILLACLFFAINASPRLTAVLQRRHRWLVAASLALLGWLVYMSFAVWEPVIRGATGLEYSSAYRPALYSFLPDIIEAAPFGFGFGSVPSARWIMVSELRGALDITRTIDSEVVYLVLAFGALGIPLFAMAAVIGVRALPVHYGLGAACSIVTGTGLILALHAWDSVGPWWYLLLGGCLALLKDRPRGAETGGVPGSSGHDRAPGDSDPVRASSARRGPRRPGPRAGVGGI